MKEKKKGFDYFDSLVKMSQFALEEAKYLKTIFSDFKHDKIEENYAHMHDLEHKCDSEKHLLTTALVKEFLPPIDRDDLFRLSHITDNITDSVENIIAFFYMADIKSLRDDVMPFADLIIECCENVEKMLTEFRNFKKSTKLKEYVIILNDLEEKGDKLYSNAMRRLSKEDCSTREVIEWRDIYKIFESCCDAAESLADNIESVIMKNT